MVRMELAKEKRTAHRRPRSHAHLPTGIPTAMDRIST